MQKVIIALGDPVVASAIQQIMSSVLTPGILNGMQLTTTAADTIAIQPGVAMTDSGVFIFEDEQRTEPFTLTVAPANFTIFYQYVPSNNFGGNPAVLTIQNGLIPAEGFLNGVVLGWIKYPGGSVPLDANSMFISGPRLQLKRDELQEPNNYIKTFSPLSTRWGLKSLTGPAPTVTEVYDGTYKSLITMITNGGISASQPTYLVPIAIPFLGLGSIEVELQTDSPAIVTVTILDSQGNEIVPIGPGGFNFFTNSAMAQQNFVVPYAAGLTPNSEAFIKLAIEIQPGSSVRFKSVGISSYVDPF